MTMVWVLCHPKATAEVLGFLPAMLSADDPRPAREQLDEAYQHGGGWDPVPGFTIDGESLLFPGDPPQELVAETRLRDEIIRLYPYSFVAIIQPDGSFEVARMD